MNWRRWLLLPFLVLPGVQGIIDTPSGTSLVCVTPPSGYSGKKVVTGYTVWTCPSPDSNIWNTGDRVIVSNCTDSTLLESSVTCGPSQFPECSGPAPTPNNTIQVGFNVSGSPFAFIFVCNDGMQWLSGQPAQISQCFNGNWTSIMDVCDYGCPIPRDCSDLAGHGFNTSGLYSVVPSGNANDQLVQVWCDMSEVPGDSGWTQVLLLSVPLTPPVTFDMTGATGQPNNGSFYFIGFNALTNLNWDVNETVSIARPLVVQVELVKQDGSRWFATYDTVVMNSVANFVLQSVGSYQGNVGEVLSASVGQGVGTGSLLWSCTLGSSCVTLWWNSITWGTLSFVQATVSVRTKTFDQVVCPTGYTEVKGTCFMFLTQVPQYGIVSASLQCKENNGSLAVISSVDQLSTATPGVFYYTAHIFNGSGFSPPPPAYTCVNGETCVGSQDLGCLAVSVQGTSIVARAQSRYRNDTFASCTVPYYCPSNFSSHLGLCYTVLTQVSPPGSFIAALESCNTLGAALAYPETLDALSFQVDLVKTSVGAMQPDGISVLMGLNFVLGPTVQGIYAPDTEVLNLAQGSSWAFRMLDINQSEYFVSVNLTATVPTPYAVCQLYGPQECWSAAPEAMANMTRTYDNTANITSQATYKCYPGYFLGGVVAKTTTSRTCLGQLGGWGSPVPNCVPVEVCGAPVWPSGINITEWANSYMLNGTLIFTCPVNMATQTLNATQTLTCTMITAKKVSYTFIPSVVEPCNVCLGEPLLNNYTTDWSTSTKYLNGFQVNATCLPGYQLQLGVTSQPINCMESGWSQAPACYLACVDDPLTVANITWNITNNDLGTILNYTCPEGEFMFLNGSIMLLNTTTVTCGADGRWTPASLPRCLYYCVEEPLVANATTDWLSTGVYVIGDTVTATCLPTFMLDPDNITQSLTCNESGWSEPTPCYKGCSGAPPQAGVNMSQEVLTSRALGSTLQYICYPDQLMFLSENQVVGNVTKVTCEVDGLWNLSGPLPDCSLPTDQPPVVLPVNAGLLEGPDPPYIVNSTFIYSCAAGFVPLTGIPDTNITYNGTDWVMEDDYFKCVASTDQPPVVLPVNAGLLEGPDPPYIVNSTFIYSCAAGFVPLTGIPDTNITYNGTDWVMEDDYFKCVASKYKQSSRKYTYDWISY